MKFNELACYLQKLEMTSSRLKITEILADLFQKSSKNEIDKICYLVLGSLAPSYKNIVFNVAEKMMQEAISKAYQIKKDEVVALYKKLGDLGDVAAGLGEGSTIKENKSLNVLEVYKRLYDLAVDEGEGSQDRKIDQLAKLLSMVDVLSSKYIARIPLGKLRLGFSDKTILDALSWMKTGGKTKKGQLETAYNLLPDVGALAKDVKTHGIDKAVEKASPQSGIPVLPALAQRLKSPQEMIKKMTKVAIEPKYDGLRIQIHFKKGQVWAFTRNLNENSWMFPELKEVGKFIKADQVILDTEAVGVDEKRKSLANFQTTMTRRRKHDIEKIASKVKIRFMVFDILLLNGKNLMKKDYLYRREVLQKTIKDSKLLHLVDYLVTDNPQVIEEQMRRELKEGMEGIIVKKASSSYVAGRTGWRWVKMKEEEGAKAKLADTVDCVVMGYYRGRGKRAEFGLGGFLVGIINDQSVLTLTKIGTGLTDDQFRELKKRLKKLEVKEKPKGYYKVEKTLVPDVWVEPSLVVEIAADEITKSPLHSSGYALRFPRLVKFRDDKDVLQTTSVSEIKKLFKLQ